jgi:hypothetical protein
MRLGRRAAPVPPSAAPDLLAALGGVRFAVAFGWWAYVLFEDADCTRPFYVGISGHLCGRLGTHHDNHGARLAAIMVFPSRDQHQARVTQLLLIDRLEGDLINVLGSQQYLRYRREAEQAAKRLDMPEHVARTMKPDYLPS